MGAGASSGLSDSLRGFIEKEFNRLRGDQPRDYLVLTEVLRFKAIRDIPVDFGHMGTLYAVDADKDGRFTLDELCRFAEDFSDFRSSCSLHDFEIRVRGEYTLRMWRDVARRAGEAGAAEAGEAGAAEVGTGATSRPGAGGILAKAGAGAEDGTERWARWFSTLFAETLPLCSPQDHVDDSDDSEDDVYTYRDGEDEHGKASGESGSGGNAGNADREGTGESDSESNGDGNTGGNTEGNGEDEDSKGKGNHDGGGASSGGGLLSMRATGRTTGRTTGRRSPDLAELTRSGQVAYLHSDAVHTMYTFLEIHDTFNGMNFQQFLDLLQQVGEDMCLLELEVRGCEGSVCVWGGGWGGVVVA